MIDGIPPSLNHSHQMSTRYGRVRVFPAKELKQWYNFVNLTQRDQIINKKTWYGVEIMFYFDTKYKNGEPKRKDIDNMAKAALDAFCKKVCTQDGERLDDCQINELHIYKVNGEEKTKIMFYCIQ